MLIRPYINPYESEGGYVAWGVSCDSVEVKVARLKPLLRWRRRRRCSLRFLGGRRGEVFYRKKKFERFFLWGLNSEGDLRGIFTGDFCRNIINMWNVFNDCCTIWIFCVRFVPKFTQKKPTQKAEVLHISKILLAAPCSSDPPQLEYMKPHG